MSAQHYTCPLCAKPLQALEGRYCCENNHSFDQAKEGYVNLLPVQFKHSQQPGDNKAMVNARRLFLEKGYYQPLVQAITLLCNDFKLANNRTPFVLDAGCGEGYYSHHFQHQDNVVYGVDIAKEAIKKAAKKYQQCHFSVGTLSKLPFPDQQFHWIISIYAPILEQEFTRVLQQHGFLLTVTPAKKHLIELKNYIYDDALEHDDEKEVIEHLTLITQKQVSYTMNITTGADVINLLSMTPFAFKASEQVKQTLATLTDFTCQADFMIRLYQKN